ncbi:MAG: Gfo/Idh/MocA family oxidoreductase [Verrucomicrobiota bacterium]
MTELNIGVIGCGGRGGVASHAHRPDKGIKLVAAADIVREHLESFRKDYGPDVFVTKDYRELLAREDIHAVFITTPDYLHEEQTLAALDAGKHVYLEKPMAITIEGCDKILQKAYDKKLKLYLGHNMRHMGFILKMKELIDSGVIGEVKAGWCRHFIGYGGDAYFKDWHADRTKSTSLLLQKGAHDIDILHWLCGGYSRTVSAMGDLGVYSQIADRHDGSERADVSWHDENWPPLSQKGLNPVIDVEDLSMMLMTLDNGVHCSYQQCHYTPDSWRNYTIIGTKGRIENFGDNPGECVVRVWNSRKAYNPYGDEQYFMKPEAGSHGGADPRIVHEFVRWITKGGKIATSPVAARNSVAAGCMATESLRNGAQPQSVPGLPPELVEYFDKPRNM